MDLNGDGKSDGLDFALFEEMNSGDGSGGGGNSGCSLGCAGYVLITLIIFSIIKFIAGCIY